MDKLELILHDLTFQLTFEKFAGASFHLDFIGSNVIIDGTEYIWRQISTIVDATIHVHILVFGHFAFYLNQFGYTILKKNLNSTSNGYLSAVKIGGKHNNRIGKNIGCVSRGKQAQTIKANDFNSSSVEILPRWEKQYGYQKTKTKL